MKKLMILLSFLFALALTKSKGQTDSIGLNKDSVAVMLNPHDTVPVPYENMGQEFIFVAGVGLFQDTRIAQSNLGNYEFVEGRLMFGHRLRVGPVINYTIAGLKNSDNYRYRGRFFTAGLSFDGWGNRTFHAYYFWLNTGLRWSYDRGTATNYHSWQKDQLFLCQGGFRLTNTSRTWLNNSLLIVEWQQPLTASEAVTSVTPGVYLPGKPDPKGGLRATYENALTRTALSIGGKIKFMEPLVHAGYGRDKGFTGQYVEFGGGLSIGYIKDWYREPVKIQVFKRQGLYHNSVSSINLEIIINLNHRLRN